MHSPSVAITIGYQKKKGGEEKKLSREGKGKRRESESRGKRVPKWGMELENGMKEEDICWELTNLEGVVTTCYGY